MSEVTEMSTIDLYTEVRYVNEKLECEDEMNLMEGSTAKKLRAYKQELLEEIYRRDNERFR